MGNQQFNNQTIISAVTSRKIGYLQQIVTTPIAAGSTLQITLYAPVNNICQLMDMTVVMDGMASSTGTQDIFLNINNAAQTLGFGIFKLTGNATSQVIYDQNGVQGTSSSHPTAEGDIANAYRAVQFDQNIGLQFNFRNNGSVTHTGNKKVIIFYSQEVVSQ